MRFSERMVAEVLQTFWAAMPRGEFITDAALRPARIARRVRGGWRTRAVCGRAAAGI